MDRIDEILDLYEANNVRLAHALERGGGSLVALLDTPLRNVLYSFARNSIHLEADYTGAVVFGPSDKS